MKNSTIYEKSNIKREDTESNYGEVLGGVAFILIMIFCAISNLLSKKNNQMKFGIGPMSSKLKNQINIYNEERKRKAQKSPNFSISEEIKSNKETKKSLEPAEIKKMREIEEAKEMKKTKDIEESKAVEKKSGERVRELIENKAKITEKSLEKIAEKTAEAKNTDKQNMPAKEVIKPTNAVEMKNPEKMPTLKFEETKPIDKTSPIEKNTTTPPKSEETRNQERAQPIEKISERATIPKIESVKIFPTEKISDKVTMPKAEEIKNQDKPLPVQKIISPKPEQTSDLQKSNIDEKVSRSRIPSTEKRNNERSSDIKLETIRQSSNLRGPKIIERTTENLTLSKKSTIFGDELIFSSGRSRETLVRYGNSVALIAETSLTSVTKIKLDSPAARRKNSVNLIGLM